jgi:hypothetical protein
MPVLRRRWEILGLSVCGTKYADVREDGHYGDALILTRTALTTEPQVLLKLLSAVQMVCTSPSDILGAAFFTI